MRPALALRIVAIARGGFRYSSDHQWGRVSVFDWTRRASEGVEAIPALSRLHGRQIWPLGSLKFTLDGRLVRVGE